MLLKNSTKTGSQSHQYSMTRRDRSFLMNNLSDVEKRKGRDPEETAAPAPGLVGLACPPGESFMRSSKCARTTGAPRWKDKEEYMIGGWLFLCFACLETPMLCRPSHFRASNLHENMGGCFKKNKPQPFNPVSLPFGNSDNVSRAEMDPGGAGLGPLMSQSLLPVAHYLIPNSFSESHLP